MTSKPEKCFLTFHSADDEGPVGAFTCCMRVLVASDKFKGSLSASEACESIAAGVLNKHPHAQVECFPLADGGEGTSELLAFHTDGRMYEATVTGPLPENVKGAYGISGDGKTAFIESAQASGLQLLPLQKRNPLLTSSFGTGELISEAIRKGVQSIALGIGGTATNDAGIGLAAALGYRFLDGNGRSLDAIGKNLKRIEAIVQPQDGSISAIKFIALCDVDNPLYGPAGAAYVYGPQKGADEEALKILDEGLINFERVVRESLHKEANFPGAGAGGGMAAGAKVFLDAVIRSGMDYVAEVTHLEQRIRSVDLVITGEGKIDTQTLAGKVVGTVASLARKFGKKVIAICGVCELREVELHKLGISKVISIVDPFTDTAAAVRNARTLVKDRVSDGI
jgi:glycerate kinase